MESAARLSTDGRRYYTLVRDPEAVFNRLEITLSHLFRAPLEVLGGRTYSGCLLDYLQARHLVRPDVVEVGCGLGDLARGLLDGARSRRIGIGRYQILDISPQLLEFVKVRLGDDVECYRLGDCTELASHFDPGDWLVVCNAVIADLRSDYLEPGQPIADDATISPFTEAWTRAEGPTYVHVGALQLISQLGRVLGTNGTACILDFAATDLNQPAVFTNPETGVQHFKCGIDFRQLRAFAEWEGFEAEVQPIERVLGISPAQEFLTVDVFTRLADVADEHPVASVLGAVGLPVGAYTPKALTAALARVGVDEPERVVDALAGMFYSIHDPRFDRTNPTTWGYQVLTLRRPA